MLRRLQETAPRLCENSKLNLQNSKLNFVPDCEEDAMRDKVILGITLTVVLLLTLVIYMGVDAQRGPATTEEARAAAVDNGRHIFAKYCIQCHGAKGEGCIGPA